MTITKQTAAFIAGVVLSGIMLAAGCVGWNPLDPKVISPISNQPVTAAQLQIELREAEQKAESEQRAADRKFARTLKAIQSQAEADIQAATDEYQDETGQRAASVDSIRARVAISQAEIERRKTFVNDSLDIVNTVAQSTGVVPLIGGVGLLTGIAGMMLGRKTGEVSVQKQLADARVEAEQKASLAHDEAWEESKKELLSLMTMLANRGSSPTS